MFPANPTHKPIEKGSNKFGTSLPAFGLIQILLPATPGLVLFKFYGGPNHLFLSAASIQAEAACPACLTLSQAVHSYSPGFRFTLVGVGDCLELTSPAILLLQP